MVRITFVGDFVYNYGSAQTVLEYSKISKDFGVSISICGYIDNIIASKIPVIKKVNKMNTDITIFIFENIMYLDPNKYSERLSWYLENTERQKRIVIDTDAKYRTKVNNLREPEGYDQKMWDFVIDKLSDVVLQPVIEPVNKNTLSFLFFGFPEVTEEATNKKFDVSYVGNNWFRKDEMAKFLLASYESNSVSKVNIHGKNWNINRLQASLPDATNLGHPQFDIKVGESVMPEYLLNIMSSGAINPILVNDILVRRRLVTPRMFETFAADTVPLFYDNFDYYQKIYGLYGRYFCASDDGMKNKINAVIKDYKKYRLYRNYVRKYLISNHSYSKRIVNLKKIISNL